MVNDDSLEPMDEYNQALARQVQPVDWINPEPKARYHLVVIGAGTAGLVSAAGAAALGAKVALVERRRMGGDCLNFGCVPSKALLRAARAAADVRKAAEFGVHVTGEVRVDFPGIMHRMRKLRAEISPNDSAQRFRGLGVDVFFGAARFIGPDRLTVGDKTLHFRRAIIAAGTRPAVPAIAGLADAGYLTNESIFSLTELPERLAILGAGPVGCELAQAFACFGSRVTLIANDQRILGRADAQAASLVARHLRSSGVEILFSGRAQRVELRAGLRVLHVEVPGSEVRAIEADAILVATGRMANVENWGLETAHVNANAKTGVIVDDRLRTTNPRIFAAGDVASQFMFTHAADAYARIAVQNALFYGRARASALVIPWCIFTDPEIAHVGMDEIDAQAAGVPIQTFLQEFAHVDRAILDGEADGFAKIHVRAGTDRIVGATIVARHAGDMIGEVTLAMVSKLGLKELAKTIHPYPTQAEALRKLGDAHARTRLTPTVRWLFDQWFRWLT